MTGRILINILRLCFLVLLQVLILDNINFGGYVNPYFYVYFILLLPFEVPGWLLLISAFVMGFSIDIFEGTLGMHTASLVLMAYLRPAVINSIASRKEFEPGMRPSISDLGFQWFFSYAVILILVHHISLFYIEIFRFADFFITLRRALFSTLFTLLLVILSQYIFFIPSKKS
jgi:rod shape-determining protein MreD